MRTVTRILAAGAAAAAGFAAWSIGSFAVGGHGAWRPVNLIAHLVWRGAPTGGRFSVLAAVVGLALLLVAGIVLIAPYALLTVTVDLSPPPVVVAGGPIYTTVAWIIGDYLAWPKLDHVGAHGFSPGVAWVAHIVAGVVAGIVLIARPGLRRAMTGRRPAPGLPTQAGG